MSTAGEKSQPSYRRDWYQRGRTSAPWAEMRVSDTERSEIAELLSQHFSDGRLDETEFKARLDQAMGAKTRADLSGLLYDLPHPEEKDGSKVRARGWRGFRATVLALLMVAAVLATFAFSFQHFGWIVVALVIFAIVRRRHMRYGRYYADRA